MTAKPSSSIVQLTAGVPRVLHANGRHVHVKEATAPVLVRFDDEATIELDKGMGAEDVDGYRQLTILSAVDQTITLIRSRGPIVDGRQGGTINVQTNLDAATITELKKVDEVAAPAVTALKEKSLEQDTLDAIAKPHTADRFQELAAISVGITATEIAAANPNRRALIVSLLPGADPIVIGSASVTALQGAIVAPGAPLTIETTGAVYGITTGAATQTFIAETYRS